MTATTTTTVPKVDSASREEALAERVQDDIGIALGGDLNERLELIEGKLAAFASLQDDIGIALGVLQRQVEALAGCGNYKAPGDETEHRPWLEVPMSLERFERLVSLPGRLAERIEQEREQALEADSVVSVYHLGRQRALEDLAEALDGAEGRGES